MTYAMETLASKRRAGASHSKERLRNPGRDGDDHMGSMNCTCLRDSQLAQIDYIDRRRHSELQLQMLARAFTHCQLTVYILMYVQP